MCYTRGELEKLHKDEEKKEEQKEVELGNIDEVKRFEHLPSSLPHDNRPLAEPTLAPA
jgi:hypothetical protein